MSINMLIVPTTGSRTTTPATTLIPCFSLSLFDFCMAESTHGSGQVLKTKANMLVRDVVQRQRDVCVDH